jgi:hypothetical protein
MPECVEMMEFDAFISYSSPDKAAANAACAYLESAGVRCWIAPRDIMAGGEYGAAIIEAIDRCRVMVLIFSTSANNSRQIRREIERAVSKGVTIVPLRIEEVVPTESMEYFLGAIHWLDALTPPLETHLQKLADTVKTLVEVTNAKTAPDASTAPPAREKPSFAAQRQSVAPNARDDEHLKSQIPRRLLPASLAAACLVLALGGLWIYLSRAPAPVRVPAAISVPQPAQKSTASTVAPSQTDPPGSYEPATNREGITVRDFNLSSPDARLCQSLCIEEPQCTAWVYRSAQGRTDGQPHCWLRNNVVKMKGDNLTISGDVQR